MTEQNTQSPPLSSYVHIHNTHVQKRCTDPAWWLMDALPALKRLRKQEHHEFKASLSNLEIGAGKRKGAGKGKRMD